MERRNTIRCKSVWAVCIRPVTERVIYGRPLKPSVLGFPDGPSGSDSMLPLRGSWVQVSGWGTKIPHVLGCRPKQSSLFLFH